MPVQAGHLPVGQVLPDSIPLQAAASSVWHLILLLEVLIESSELLERLLALLPTIVTIITATINKTTIVTTTVRAIVIAFLSMYPNYMKSYI